MDAAFSFFPHNDNERKMNERKIVLFMCNWSPHAAYQTLQDNSAAIPPEVRMVRIPCTGRMSKSLLFRAFEMGADGVALVGCEAGSCRYGSGTAVAERNVQDMRGILELLGLGKERLRWATFLPEQAADMLAFLQEFHQEIEQIGASPVHPVLKQGQPSVVHENILNLMTTHDVFACQDCGKCSSACPLSLSGKPFSPRAMATMIAAGTIDSPSVEADIWGCLTCGLCYDRCPSAVDFPEFIRDMRKVHKAAGKTGQEAHGGFFHSLMRTMTSPELKIQHWNWLPPDIRLDSNSKTLFFGGCAPYFDTYFKHHLGVRTSDILVDSLRLLNFFDIFPAILPGERCCGHDLLWTGDADNFSRLAELNVSAIENLGIEEVVTACPECYRTLSRDYAEVGVPIHFKVTHIFDLAEREIDKGAIGFDDLPRKITFQDPCRLARLNSSPPVDADLPRKLISRIQPQAFQEMQDRGASALCCGNCAWTGCDAYTKALQVKRLRQAKETGSDLLVTACPKCQIHLRCAMEDLFFGEELKMEMKDLTSILAQTIRWE